MKTLLQIPLRFCNCKLFHFNKIRESNLMKSFLLASGAEIIVLALRTLVTNPRNLPAASVTRDTLRSISPTFYERICNNFLAPKNFQTLNVTTKKLRAERLHEKAARKMFVKLTPCGHLRCPLEPAEDMPSSSCCAPVERQLKYNFKDLFIFYRTKSWFLCTPPPLKAF